MDHKISVIGMGYVGCGNGLMFSKKFKVSIMDIDQKKVHDFNNKRLPIHDLFAQKYFKSEGDNLNIQATSSLLESIKDASFILLCLPTNFDDQVNKYNTETIEETISTILTSTCEATIVVKSTVNVGYTESLKRKFKNAKIIFSPEFLREGHALEDNLYPSRIIIGAEDDNAKLFGECLSSVVKAKNTRILFMSSSAAESVKLFSNTYLAMRVAYFNELDSFCLKNDIDPKDVIDGVSNDKRIGNFYNNPSFGFGGYCLPKDSKQLLHRFGNTHHDLVEAIQHSNLARINFLTDEIMSSSPNTVGIYKLSMKEGLENSRGSTVFKIIEKLLQNKVKIFIYDPSIHTLDIEGAYLIDSFDHFKTESDLIVANRIDSKIKAISKKVFTRDIFSSDE